VSAISLESKIRIKIKIKKIQKRVPTQERTGIIYGIS